MPECVHFEIVKAGTVSVKTPVLVLSPNDASACDGYLLLTPSEFNSQNTGSQNIDVWNFDPVSSGQFFGFSFVLILTCYLVAWGFGELIRFVR